MTKSGMIGALIGVTLASVMIAFDVPWPIRLTVYALGALAVLLVLIIGRDRP